MKKYTLLCLVLLLFVMSVKTQIPAKKEKDKKSFLIQKNRPSVYIEFEKFGDEKNKRVWLKLHNNTRSGISFCSFVIENPYEVRVVYDVRNTPFPSGRPLSDDTITEEDKELIRQETPPDGFSTGDSCSVFNLASGKSVLFSIPSNHISRKFFIEVGFWYDWENRDNELGNFPRSYVTFHHSQLP